VVLRRSPSWWWGDVWWVGAGARPRGQQLGPGGIWLRVSTFPGLPVAWAVQNNACVIGLGGSGGSGDLRAERCVLDKRRALRHALPCPEWL
jgi:hypothetical protein